MISLETRNNKIERATIGMIASVAGMALAGEGIGFDMVIRASDQQQNFAKFLADIPLTQDTLFMGSVALGIISGLLFRNAYIRRRQFASLAA